MASLGALVWRRLISRAPTFAFRVVVEFVGVRRPAVGLNGARCVFGAFLRILGRRLWFSFSLDKYLSALALFFGSAF